MLRLFGTVVMRRRVVHRPSEERATADDSDVPAPEDLDPDMQYVWGLRYIDDLILRDRDTSNPKNGTLNERLYAMQDPNWNVVALADSDGDVVERYLYSAYGDPVVLNADFGAGEELARTPGASDLRVYGYTGTQIEKADIERPLRNTIMQAMTVIREGTDNPSQEGLS